MFTLSVFSPAHSEEEKRRNARPLDGELLLPDEYSNAEEKKCLTVCDEWGKDCILDPSTRSQKCRRICKVFAEECF